MCPGGMLTAVPNGSTLNHPGHRETRSNPTLFRNSSFALWIPGAKANFVNVHIDHALNGQRPTTWVQLKNGKGGGKKKKKERTFPDTSLYSLCSIACLRCPAGSCGDGYESHAFFPSPTTQMS